jgi:transposase-like protein
MGQILHGCATTREAVRRAIQHSQASLRELARRYGMNPKSIAKWRKRTSVADLPTGPREAHSSTLSHEQEAIIVTFRRHTLLPLDDCLYALQATISQLTRSALHRRLQRHGISRLPEVERMNRTIKHATVKRFQYDNNDQLRRHLDDFVAAYNFARRLKRLRGLTP